MKNFLLFLAILILVSCSYEREAEGELLMAYVKSTRPIKVENEEIACEIIWTVVQYNLDVRTVVRPPYKCDNFIVGIKYPIIVHK